MNYRDYSDREENETVYIWNRVTKHRITARRNEANAEIAKQKYPQNWVVINTDTCGNCGGEWDGEHNCASYCLETIVGREDPNPDMTELGEVMTWREVFEKAIDLYCDEKIDILATVSQTDFQNGQWFAPVITSLEYLHSLRAAAPSVYPKDAKFRLFLSDTLLEPSNLRKVTTQLIVVRLQQGEEFKGLPKIEK